MTKRFPELMPAPGVASPEAATIVPWYPCPLNTGYPICYPKCSIDNQTYQRDGWAMVATRTGAWRAWVACSKA
jgi:hypothetical protein